jgi:hypothetical protein
MFTVVLSRLLYHYVLSRLLYHYVNCCFVQTALPLEGAPHLIGPNGGKVTKLFIYAPLDAYPLITQVCGAAARCCNHALSFFYC